MYVEDDERSHFFDKITWISDGSRRSPEPVRINIATIEQPFSFQLKIVDTTELVHSCGPSIVIFFFFSHFAI